MNPDPTTTTGLSRRNVLLSSTATALGLAGLAACDSGDDESSASTEPAQESSPTESSPPGEDGGLVALSEVPVGGAVSANGKDGEPLIVAQPSKGTVVAFSAICTHRGCTVAPQSDILECPCHGSTFDIATGDNTGGPAPSPLEEVPVTVSEGVVRQT
jgi:Rieske Fe-S protein